MTLGLCMIVKNESDVLVRVLDGIRAAVDEIVIVDTGSTDNTAEIARRYTDKVYSYDWNDDFSAARNFALSHITSDYWIWLDADDIVPKRTVSRIIDFKGSADGTVDAVMMPYRMGVRRGKDTFTFYRERIIKNRPEFRWKGRVHETVGVYGNLVKIASPVVHAKPPSRSHSARNLDIYEKMRREGVKFEPREVYYYARELFFNGEYARAVEEFTRFLRSDGGFWVNKCDACIMAAKCCKQLGDPDARLMYALKSFAYGLPTGEACCEIAAVFFDKADYACAAYWYEAATKIRPDPTTGAFIDGECYGFIPYVWLTVCYDRSGDKAKAYKWHCKARKLRPYDASVIANQAYFEGLGYK